ARQETLDLLVGLLLRQERGCCRGTADVFGLLAEREAGVTRRGQPATAARVAARGAVAGVRVGGVRPCLGAAFAGARLGGRGSGGFRLLRGLLHRRRRDL